MKKYLSFFTIFALVVFLSVKVVRADDNKQFGDSVKLETEDGSRSLNQNVSSDDGDYEDGQDSDAENQNDDLGKKDELEKENDTIRTTAKLKMEGLKVEIKNEKNPTKAKLETEIITGRQNALDRFDGAVARISSLEDTLNTIISKLEVKGVDVTEARALVQTADLALVQAEAKIAAANTVFSASINQLTVNQKAALKIDAKDIRTLIVNAHSALKDAVKSLKDSVANKK